MPFAFFPAADIAAYGCNSLPVFPVPVINQEVRGIGVFIDDEPVFALPGGNEMTEIVLFIAVPVFRADPETDAAFGRPDTGLRLVFQRQNGSFLLSPDGKCFSGYTVAKKIIGTIFFPALLDQQTGADAGGILQSGNSRFCPCPAVIRAGRFVHRKINGRIDSGKSEYCCRQTPEYYFVHGRVTPGQLL